MAKFGLVLQGASKPVVTYEGDYMETNGQELVFISSVDGKGIKRHQAVVRLAEGQCVVKVTE